MSQVVAPPRAPPVTIAAMEPLSAPTESEGDDIGANQVVARSQVGTAFYLFNHQAGGHKPFLRSAAGEVCKPVIPLELQFYQSLDSKYPQLKSFVPPFVGVITVDLHPLTPAEEVANVAMETAADDDGQGDDCGKEQDEEQEEEQEEEEEETTCSSASGDEYKAEETSSATAVVDSQILFDAPQLQSPTNSSTATTVTATAAAVMPMTATSLSTKKRRQRGSSNRQTRSSSSASTSYSAKLWKKERSKAQNKSSSSSSSSFQQQQQLPHQQQQQQHMHHSASTLSRSISLSREYLVLGDLTHHYSHPCVLDMKMGTRQHGEDAPPAKARSHSLKCASTTSLALGLRICGMQIYDQVEQRYTLWDKHWGRQLTQDDIEQALVTYLSNGHGLHTASVRSLRDKLHDLQSLVSGTTGVRFWGSSLLLIYEGDLRNNAQRREDVHLIDFAHCQMSDELTTPDDGLLLGLANMIRFLSSILDKSGVE